MTLDAELIQGSPEWHAARCGSVGSSEIPDMVRKIKSGGVSATRASLMARKFCERMSGVPIVGYVSKAMLDGKEKEAEARSSYAILHNATIVRIGLVRHPLIKGAHASPDGLVGDLGLVEIKCPEHAAHLAMVESEKVDRDYRIQIAWQLACTGRHWCDFVSYHPDFPPALQVFEQRVERDPLLMAELEGEVGIFLAELDRKIEALNRRYLLLEAA
jgi:putative phage-type endonuclease